MDTLLNSASRKAIHNAASLTRSTRGMRTYPKTVDGMRRFIASLEKAYNTLVEVPRKLHNGYVKMSLKELEFEEKKEEFEKSGNKTLAQRYTNLEKNAKERADKFQKNSKVFSGKLEKLKLAIEKAKRYLKRLEARESNHTNVNAMKEVMENTNEFQKNLNKEISQRKQSTVKNSKKATNNNNSNNDYNFGTPAPFFPTFSFGTRKNKNKKKNGGGKTRKN